ACRIVIQAIRSRERGEMGGVGPGRIHDELAPRARRALLRGMVVALGAPLVSLAQQKIWRHGFLAARSRSTASNPDIYYDAFVQEMRSLGYVEDKNLVIEWRFADGNYDRLPGLAAELVRSNVDAIVTHGTPGVQAAKQATTTI